jgi:hypothetical protein
MLSSRCTRIGGEVTGFFIAVAGGLALVAFAWIAAHTAVGLVLHGGRAAAVAMAFTRMSSRFYFAAIRIVSLHHRGWIFGSVESQMAFQQ